jgi:hypothetical protein
MRGLWITLLGLVIGYTLAVSPLQADQRGAPVPFSADWIASEEGEPQVQGKYYASSEGIRIEGESGEEDFIMIYNFDRNLAWHVMAAERMYMETPLDPNQPGSTEDFMDGLGTFGSPCSADGKGTRIGPATLHGRKVEKWTCEVPGEKTITVWYDKRIQIPIRSEDEDGSYELKNIKEGRLSVDLFLPPAGYTKFAMPAGLPFGNPSSIP